MNILIKEFLAEYSIEIPESVGMGSIYRLTYSEDYKNIAFFARYSQMQTAADCAADDVDCNSKVNLNGGN